MNNNKKTKILKWIFPIIGIIAGAFIFNQDINKFQRSFGANFFNEVTASEDEKFEKFLGMWKEDLKDLDANEALPLAWYKISKIDWIGSTEMTLQWKSALKGILKIQDGGNHTLEVFMHSWNDENGEAVMIQHSLINQKPETSSGS